MGSRYSDRCHGYNHILSSPKKLVLSSVEEGAAGSESTLLSALDCKTI